MSSLPVISTQKIVLLMMFIAASIMTSVILFRWHHQVTLTAQDQDEVFIFPEARTLNAFTLTKPHEQPFSSAALQGHWTLLFFGFTHCEMVCPTTLSMIGNIYPTLQKNYPNLQVVFVSLDPARDTPDMAMHYAQSFNTAFIGVTGKTNELRKLQSQLGIYSAQGQVASNNYQIQHTASIMLVNPRGQWAGIFKFGMRPAQFARVFKDKVKM